MTHPACQALHPGEASPAYDHYLSLCPAGDLRELLVEQRLAYWEELLGLDEEAGRLAYAPGKWSVAALLGHLADGEQVFFERILRAARGDSSPQPGFSEDDFAASWTPSLRAELGRWLTQRRLLEAWLEDLPEGAWQSPGQVEERRYSVRALLRALVGHAEHHLAVFRERYRPLLPPRGPVPEVELASGLSLRQVRSSDLDELVTLCRAEQARLGQWLQWAEGGIDPEDTRRFLHSAQELRLRRGLPTLSLSVEGKLSGMIGLNPLEGRCAHIGYWIAASAEGRGHVRAAVRWLTAHAFEVLNLERVEVRCAVGNLRSRALPESLGFRLEGVLRGAQRLGRGPLDLVLYALCATDWPVLRPAWDQDTPRSAQTAACRVFRADQAEVVLEQAGVRGWRLGLAGGQRLVTVQLEAGAGLAPHPVPDRALFWVAEGSGRLQVDGEEYRLERGDAVLVPGGLSRGWSNTGEQGLKLHVVRGWPEG